MKEKELLKAIDIVGSRKQLGDALKVTRYQINQWLNAEIEVPIHQAIVLEDLTKGAVKVYQLISRYQDAINILKKKSDRDIYDSEYLEIKNIIQNNELEKPVVPYSLTDSETTNILERPIIVDSNYQIITGTQQVQYCIANNKKHIKAKVFDLEILLNRKSEQELKYSIHDLLISEKVAIGMALEQFIGERRGKKINFRNVYNSTHFKKNRKTRSIIAECIGLGSYFTYKQAKKVINHGSEDLINAMDYKKTSIFKASTIAKLPIKQQISFLQNIHKHKSEE